MKIDLVSKLIEKETQLVPDIVKIISGYLDPPDYFELRKEYSNTIISIGSEIQIVEEPDPRFDRILNLLNNLKSSKSIEIRAGRSDKFSGFWLRLDPEFWSNRDIEKYIRLSLPYTFSDNPLNDIRVLFGLPDYSDPNEFRYIGFEKISDEPVFSVK